ncbi:MAG: TIGR00304 family membrane protein [Nanopusillaceae archaeon]
MNNLYLILGILLIIIGLIFILTYFSQSSNVKYSAIVLIGPIPIVVSNSMGLLIISIIILVLLIIIFILFYKIII